MCADARSLFAVRSGSFVPACRSANNVLSIYAICAVLHVVPVPLLISALRCLAPPDRRQTSRFVSTKASPPSCRFAPLLIDGEHLAFGVLPFRPAPANSPCTRQGASTAPSPSPVPDRQQGAPAVPLLCTALDRRQTSHLRRAALPPCTRQGASAVLLPFSAPDRRQGTPKASPCTALDRRQTSHPRRAALSPCTCQGASNVLPPCAAHDRHQILQFSPGCVMMIQ